MAKREGYRPKRQALSPALSVGLTVLLILGLLLCNLIRQRSGTRTALAEVTKPIIR